MYVWCVQAKHAIETGAANKAAKLATARYFVDKVLPEHHALIAYIKAGKSTMMCFDNTFCDAMYAGSEDRRTETLHQRPVDNPTALVSKSLQFLKQNPEAGRRASELVTATVSRALSAAIGVEGVEKVLLDSRVQLVLADLTRHVFDAMISEEPS